jgi:hypothetical protein
MPIRILILAATLALFPAVAAQAEDGVGPGAGEILTRAGEALSGNAGALAAGAVGLAVSGQAVSAGVTETTEYFSVLGFTLEQAAKSGDEGNSLHGHGSGHGQ